jgi:hypothetical protein
MTIDLNLDVSDLDFDAWLQFFFARRLLSKGESFLETFCADAVLSRPAQSRRIVTHLEAMCSQFADIGQRYSLQQLNQGIWAMFGPDFELQQVLWDETVPLEQRLACLHSMRVPYLEFVTGHPAAVMENAFDMWWDMLLGSFWSHRGFHHDYGRLDLSDKAILDAAFETLDAILESGNERCQQYALHGLGHLHHPGVPARVDKVIQMHGHDLTSDELAWLEQCRDGTVM